jgi:hypothetical protein
MSPEDVRLLTVQRIKDGIGPTDGHWMPAWELHADLKEWRRGF